MEVIQQPDVHIKKRERENILCMKPAHIQLHEIKRSNIYRGKSVFNFSYARKMMFLISVFMIKNQILQMIFPYSQRKVSAQISLKIHENSNFFVEIHPSRFKNIHYQKLYISLENQMFQISIRFSLGNYKELFISRQESMSTDLHVYKNRVLCFMEKHPDADVSFT